MTLPELVVFDLAGTTVEDRGQVPEAFVAALAAHGLAVADEELAAVRGSSKRAAIASLVPVGGDHAAVYASFRRELGVRYADTGVRPVAGAEDVFRWLADHGVRIALNTGFDREITQMLLDRLGWRTGLADAVVCGDDVAHGRPAPDLILLAMRATGTSDPARVVNVGDTTLDLQAGHAAARGLERGRPLRRARARPIGDRTAHAPRRQRGRAAEPPRRPAMSRALFRSDGGTLVLPDAASVLCSRLDGGNLQVLPPRPVWERNELTADELTQWSFLVAAAGAAMLDALPQLEDGCINYWEAGNWALHDAADPVGPKLACDYRRMHLHLLGRSRTATHPSWRWGESPRFPEFAERHTWSAGLRAADRGRVPRDREADGGAPRVVVRRHPVPHRAVARVPDVHVPDGGHAERRALPRVRERPLARRVPRRGLCPDRVLEDLLEVQSTYSLFASTSPDRSTRSSSIRCAPCRRSGRSNAST